VSARSLPPACNQNRFNEKGSLKFGLPFFTFIDFVWDPMYFKRMSETQAIFNSLRQIVRALRLNSSQVESKTGLSGAQMFVLQKIQPGETVSVNEIAARTKTDQSSVSVVVKKLTEKKFLSRKTDPNDQRKALLSLTATGISVANRPSGLVQDHLLSAIQSLPKGERIRLAALLQKLNQIAKIDQEPTTLFFEDERPKKNANRLSQSKKT
jgi:DNA-binding MarR family transcriptional regulator